MSVINDVFEQLGWDPVEGQPGLFKSRATGETQNILDFCPQHGVFNCREKDCPHEKSESDGYDTIRLQDFKPG